MDEERAKELKKFESILSYNFNNIYLFDVALTHRSYVNENLELNLKDNERLEFLGDAVLELCISDIVMKKFPDYSEGKLSKLRASLVNEKPLAKIAEKFHVGDYILLGKGEKSSGGRTKSSILADTFEAIIAAMYLDQGYERVLLFIKNIFYPFINKWVAEPLYRDYKSQLQEFSQGRFKIIPKYELLRDYGPDHDKTFEIKLSIGDVIKATGMGKNKKVAEQEAAKKALEGFKKGTLG